MEKKGMGLEKVRRGWRKIVRGDLTICLEHRDSQRCTLVPTPAQETNPLHQQEREEAPSSST